MLDFKAPQNVPFKEVFASRLVSGVAQAGVQADLQKVSLGILSHRLRRFQCWQRLESDSMYSC